jgi:hypothetical protein
MWLAMRRCCEQTAAAMARIERERVKEVVPTSDKGFTFRMDSEALPTR